MKKIILIILILFLITGCSSYIELNDLAIIDIIAIQKNNNNYKLSISYIEEIDKDSLTPKTKIIEKESSNIFLAFDQLKLNINKKIYLSHLNMLIIDNSIKTKEIDEIINYFLNNQDSREDFLVIYSDEIKNIMQNSKFQEINDLVKINYQETSKVIYTTMYDLIKNYYNNKSFYLTKVNYDQNIFTNGIIEFKNNNYTNLEENEGIFINYLLNNLDTYSYTYECMEGKNLTLKILKATSNKLKDNLLITNEINIIANDCKYQNKEINENFTNYLKENLKKYTNKKLEIKNTIRGNYENK